MDGSQPHAGSREERIAYNEAWFRDLNERKAQWMAQGLASGGFRCECADVDCFVRLRLSPPQWEEVRSRPNRFVVAPDHVAHGVEIVVKEYPDFLLVEKQGEAARVAEELEGAGPRPT
jgi:hypothetical protein